MAQQHHHRTAGAQRLVHEIEILEGHVLVDFVDRHCRHLDTAKKIGAELAEVEPRDAAQLGR